MAPLVQSWAGAYVKTPAAVTVTYGAIGSGGGIDQITARTVDFGASDAPMTSDQATACKSCLQIPWALGAVSVEYNVKGVPNNLKLTGPVLADIYLGNISSWNDPAIAKLNPGVSLPSTHITPIYRSDGSGTSFVLTDYLSAVSPDWASKVGASTQPTFPTGTGAEHSSGVIAAMQATDGAITYSEVSYVAADHLNAAADRQRGRKLRVADREVDSRGRHCRDDAPGRHDQAGQPAGIGGRRLSAVLLYVRDRAGDLREGIGLEGVPQLRSRIHGSGLWPARVSGASFSCRNQR